MSTESPQNGNSNLYSGSQPMTPTGKGHHRDPMSNGLGKTTSTKDEVPRHHGNQVSPKATWTCPVVPPRDLVQDFGIWNKHASRNGHAWPSQSDQVNNLSPTSHMGDTVAPVSRESSIGWQALDHNGSLQITDGPINSSFGLNVGSKLCFLNASSAHGQFCSCESGQSVVTSHCQECCEDLCDDCVLAHQRVKLTRSHMIIRYNSTSSTSPLADLGTASQQQTSPPGVDPCVDTVATSEVLQVYADTVEKAKADCDKLLRKANVRFKQIESTKDKVQEMKDRVDQRFQLVKTEVNDFINLMHEDITQHGNMLINRLIAIKQVKLNILNNQIDQLCNAAEDFRQVSDNLSKSMASGKVLDLVNSCSKANEITKRFHQNFGTLEIQEDDGFHFESPNPSFLKMSGSCGYVGGSCFAPTSVADGDGIRKALVGKDSRFLVIVYDQLNDQRHLGGDPVKVLIHDPDMRTVRCILQDNHNGTYRVTWKPTLEGQHTITVTIKDQHIQGSPFRATARSGRNYQTVSEPLFIFGSEGTGPGQLSRPWGICCSQEGYILVANRSNNRIEVFSSVGFFLYNFGIGGEGPGEFNRPAGLRCDSKNRVVVADKDNHRIQVLTVKGEFILTFGERGTKIGQFHYPWDVACNSRDEIIVSDTRNHRIQLFTPKGDFITKYGLDGMNWKQFDSPRGVCFRSDIEVIVTDFNNHRLLVINLVTQMAQMLGQEGNLDGFFIRPNGIALDEEGFIIVADSRNDRIQVFTDQGVFVGKFGTNGNGSGQFDRPCGVCLSPEGKLLVVDFGNNRIQVF